MSVPVSLRAVITDAAVGCGRSEITKPLPLAPRSMCFATPSSTGDIRTLQPVAGKSPEKTLVQLGSANTASLTSRPTLRASMSKAAAMTMSLIA
jgi:hypothetical protein